MMTPQDHPPLSRFGQVRWIVWVFLVSSLLVALSLPGLSLWHAARTPITAQVCLWPPTPQVRETVRLVVSLPNATDRDAVAGPWAHLHIAWDMVTMPMDMRPIDLAGTATQAGTFSVPLQVSMPGLWWADLTLQTPGRPAWHTRVHFTVAGSMGTLQTTSASTAEASIPPCGQAIYERKSRL
jgi:hypothetical protein